jgi:hypothetical protein
MLISNSNGRHDLRALKDVGKRIPLENELFDFRDKMKGQLETSVIQAELKGLKFKISVDSSIPKCILSDP